jgi:adenine-specific DNA-methyltransferase
MAMANLSQAKRQRMLEFLHKIKEEHKDDDSILIALGEIESELTAKKYGLVWEQHEEAVDVMMRDNIPVFTEDVDREITCAAGGVYNFILEGDNLHSLRLLEKTHAGRIDLIYIDPPYNTGSKDFVYDDTIVDTTDGYRHSKWLSFMHKRLQIAYNLLSDNGVIFISIDDNEQAALKLLCDEIFGESCFITDAVWRSSDNSNNNSLRFSEDYNHTLVYSKVASWRPNFINDPSKRKHFKNPDNDPRGPWFDGNPVNNPGWRPNLQFDIEAPNGNIIKHPKNGWRWSMETIQEKLKTGELRFSEDGTRLIRRTYLNEMGGLTPSNLWIDLETTGHTRGAKYDLKKIFPEVKVTDLFSTPKPTQLIEYILQLASNDNSIILDFFAGSGTTGHAVMRYNSTHEGSNRRFILCTNNENGICEEVTYERVKRAAVGYGTTPAIPTNIKYYRTDFVSLDEEYLSDALIAHIAEMVQLEHGVKIDGNKYLMILDDDQADDVLAHWQDYPDVRALYVSRNVLFTTEQNALLADTEIHIIPDYYFNFELKEVGETW